MSATMSAPQQQQFFFSASRSVHFSKLIVVSLAMFMLADSFTDGGVNAVDVLRHAPHMPATNPHHQRRNQHHAMKRKAGIRRRTKIDNPAGQPPRPRPSQKNQDRAQRHDDNNATPTPPPPFPSSFKPFSQYYGDQSGEAFEKGYMDVMEPKLKKRMVQKRIKLNDEELKQLGSIQAQKEYFEVLRQADDLGKNMATFEKKITAEKPPPEESFLEKTAQTAMKHVMSKVSVVTSLMKGDPKHQMPKRGTFFHAEQFGYVKPDDTLDDLFDDLESDVATYKEQKDEITKLLEELSEPVPGVDMTTATTTTTAPQQPSDSATDLSYDDLGAMLNELNHEVNELQNGIGGTAEENEDTSAANDSTNDDEADETRFSDLQRLAQDVPRDAYRCSRLGESGTTGGKKKRNSKPKNKYQYKPAPEAYRSSPSLMNKRGAAQRHPAPARGGGSWLTPEALEELHRDMGMADEDHGTGHGEDSSDALVGVGSPTAQEHTSTQREPTPGRPDGLRRRKLHTKSHTSPALPVASRNEETVAQNASPGSAPQLPTSTKKRKKNRNRHKRRRNVQ